MGDILSVCDEFKFYFDISVLCFMQYILQCWPCHTETPQHFFYSRLAWGVTEFNPKLKTTIRWQGSCFALSDPCHNDPLFYVLMNHSLNFIFVTAIWWLVLAKFCETFERNCWKVYNLDLFLIYIRQFNMLPTSIHDAQSKYIRYCAIFLSKRSVCFWENVRRPDQDKITYNIMIA